jgi:predicted RecB family nuclease
MTNIKELDLSIRSFNCLRRAGIITIEKLQQVSEEDLMKIRNLGKKSRKEIRQKLEVWEMNNPVDTIPEETITLAFDINKASLNSAVANNIVEILGGHYMSSYYIRGVINDKVSEIIQQNQQQIIEKSIERVTEYLKKKAMTKILQKVVESDE